MFKGPPETASPFGLICCLRLNQFFDFTTKSLSFFSSRGFGNHADYRFCVAGANMHPGLFGTKPEAVAFIRLPASKFSLDLRENVSNLLVAEFELFLRHHVGRIFCHELFRAAIVVGHPAKHKCGSHEAIATVMERRENHTAVTFTANHATVFDHLEANVDFTDLRTTEFTTVLGGNIFVHAARGEVHANATLLLSKYFVRCNCKRVFFADTLSQTIDESAAVCIRVHGKANSTAVILDSLAQVAEIFRNRFCTTRERAIRAAMNTNNFATELFQEARHNKATGTVHGIDSDLEMLGLDGFDNGILSVPSM